MRALFEELRGAFTSYDAENPDIVQAVTSELVSRLGYKEGVDFEVHGTLIDIAYEADTAEVQEIIRDWSLEEY